MSATEELNLNTAEQIARLCEQIVREFRPQKIILFGSYAYGQPSPDSDYEADHP
ncbi:MAG: polymerase beta, Nucleotidyltransferase [Blastocatellia bacterium]